MRAKRLTSRHASDMEESLRFYVEVFGMERLPSPNSHSTWSGSGSVTSSCICSSETHCTEFHHIALDVDDFEAAT